jgi:membrane-associated phospholipid phosphatase
MNSSEHAIVSGASTADSARRDWARQFLIFLAAYLVYEAARWLTTGSSSAAAANAYRVFRVEGDFGFDVESTLQDALVDLPVMTLLNYVYLAAQLAVVPLTLVWLYRRQRSSYLLFRNGILGTWLISVPVYAFFPVAPPRLAGIGIADTVTAQAGIPLDSNFSTVFYNAFAAVPSLHSGFAFAVGIAVAVVARHAFVRLLGLLWGPLVVLAVIATGNHFLLDVIAGLAATAAGFGLALLVRPANRTAFPRLRRRAAARASSH